MDTLHNSLSSAMGTLHSSVGSAVNTLIAWVVLWIPYTIHEYFYGYLTQ